LGTVFVSYGQKRKKGKEKAQKENTDITTVKPDYRQPGAVMPPLRLVTEKGKQYTEKDVDNGAYLFIMLFNPMCDHCHDETKLLGENIDLFKKSDILLMASPNMKEYLEYFENSTKVSKYPKMIVGLDSAGYIEKTFRYLDLPQINIYDKDRKLVRMFNGHTPLDSLRQFIE
jgi:hypothetical protein